MNKLEANFSGCSLQPSQVQKWKTVSIRNLSIAKMAGKSFFKLTFKPVVTLAKKLFRIRKEPCPNHLLKGKKSVPHSQLAWHLNLGVMRHAYKFAKTQAEKDQIKFLASHFLYKSAPIHLNRLKTFSLKFEKLFQISPFSKIYYHRFSTDQDFNSPQNNELALSKRSPLVLVDTVNCEHLFPLKFQVLDHTVSSESLAEKVVQKFRNQSDKNFLFDLSEEYHESIWTKGDRVKERKFCKDYRNFQKKLEDVVALAVNKCLADNPSLNKKILRKNIENSMTTICRVQTDKFSGIKLLPNFSKNNFRSFLDFVSLTGLRISFINRNRLNGEGWTYRPDLEYAGKEGMTLYFKSAVDLLETQLFKRLSAKFNVPESEPHVAVVGKATLQMLHTLLWSCSRTKWHNLNQNPAKQEIIQTSLFKIHELMASAEICRQDFAYFAQNIELIHAEISILLEVISPFSLEDFSSIYANQLQSVPENLKSFVKAGLCKTGMNFFAGIGVALSKSAVDPVMVHSKGCYYELAELLDCNKKNADNLPAKNVDLYCCQPNPGVDISGQHTHYAPHDYMGDIYKILESKTQTTPLTVVVDCTIDYLNSPKVQVLLTEFEKEIKSGKLNFIFFRSGQKFDMLGMDNYYGAPFYMVNNRSSHWKAFDLLFNDEALKPDTLSAQWFCLANFLSAHELDNYRCLVFENTKTILNQVPDVLKPGAKKNQRVRVNTVDSKLNSCFIDIKLTGRFHRLRGYAMLAHFYKKCMERGIKSHSRASFGFYHINSSIFPFDAKQNSSTIRISPGLNPAENQVIIDFLKDLVYNV